MSTIFEAAPLERLVERLRTLPGTATRRWGTLTVGEMFCHLADATDWAQGIRVPPGIEYPATVKWVKWIALYLPFPWPKGYPTKPGFDPKREGTKPGDLERDRRRCIDSLVALSGATEDRLAPAHMGFGPMTRTDWGRWAYRHADHHLRQFGG